MGTSLWFDELWTSRLFVGPPLVLAKTLFSDIHPPAYFLFMHVWIAVFGDGEWALRLPPLLFGLGSLYLLQRLGATLFGATVGWLAALGMAVSPTHIWYSTEARPYSASIFLALAFVASYVRLRRSPGLRLIAVRLFLLGVLTAMCHYYLVVLPAGLCLFDAIERKRGFRARMFGTGSAVVAALGFVFLKARISDVPTGKWYLRDFTLSEWASLWFDWFPTGRVFSATDFGQAVDGLWGGWLAVFLPLIFGVLLVVGLACAARHDLRSFWWVVCAASALPLGIWMLARSGFQQIYIERSALPSMPFVYLLFALGATSIARLVPRWRGVWYGALVCSSIATCIAFFQRDHLWTVYKPNPDWRAATAVLSAALPADHEQLIVLSDYPSPAALTYYDDRIQELRSFEFNTNKWQRTEQKLLAIPWIGAWLSDLLADRRLDWEGQIERTRALTRALVLPLTDASIDGIRRFERPVWLLLYSRPSVRAQALLHDARFEWGVPVKVRGLALIPLVGATEF